MSKVLFLGMPTFLHIRQPFIEVGGYAKAVSENFKWKQTKIME
ncbi:hypothetical protein [Parafilimonas sp.]